MGAGQALGAGLLQAGLAGVRLADEMEASMKRQQLLSLDAPPRISAQAADVYPQLPRVLPALQYAATCRNKGLEGGFSNARRISKILSHSGRSQPPGIGRVGGGGGGALLQRRLRTCLSTLEQIACLGSQQW